MIKIFDAFFIDVYSFMYSLSFFFYFRKTYPLILLKRTDNNF